MTTNQTIDGVPRELIERAAECMEQANYGTNWARELRALLDAPAVSLADEGEMQAAQHMGETVEVVARWSDWSMLTLEIDGQHRTYVDTGRPEQPAPLAVAYQYRQRPLWRKDDNSG